MAMKRTKEPWMRAEDFGRSLPRGIGVNLLVTEVAPAETFCALVLGANTVYADEDFAAIELLGSVLMLHADHSYLDHDMAGVTAGVEIRGVGIEIRLYGADPDHAEAKARNTATSCWPAAWTNRTACANATSPGRTANLRSKPGDLRHLRAETVF